MKQLRIVQHNTDGTTTPFNLDSDANIEQYLQIKKTATVRHFDRGNVTVYESPEGTLEVKTPVQSAPKFYSVQQLPKNSDLIHIMTESGREIDLPMEIRESGPDNFKQVGGKYIRTVCYRGWLVPKELTAFAVEFLNAHHVTEYVNQSKPLRWNIRPGAKKANWY